MPTAMPKPSRKASEGGRVKLSIGGMPTENWVAIITIAALVLLILIRRGFRGINI